jgi:putative flavoprotein involved in K+ transport
VLRCPRRHYPEGGSLGAVAANAAAVGWLRAFAAALAGTDPACAVRLFEPDGYWRDLVIFSWNLTTAEGHEQLRDTLLATAARTRARDFVLDGDARARDDGVIEAVFRFRTEHAGGRGLFRLRDGRCWTLLTAMAGLHAHPETVGRRRPQGVHHGAWRAAAQARAERPGVFGETAQPYCLIVGSGQGGLALAARLKQLAVPTLVIDRHPRPGDAWRRRYKSLCLHDPVWYDHLPYLPFPPTWPVFSPKDKLADWLAHYAQVMDLDVWGNSPCRRARHDAATGTWEVHVERDGRDVLLRPTHLVLATGMSGVPAMPDIPGAASFEGDLHHSSAHPGPDHYAGKRCVVLGANNSAHDICAALWEHGADVTMIQRSSTLVVRSETQMNVVLSPLYSEQSAQAGFDHEAADFYLAATPFGILPTVHKPLWDRIRRQDAEYYRALEAVGFQLDFGDDDSGLHLKYLRRGSGYYIDVGASALVASGRIKLRSRVGIASIGRRSVTLTDGAVLPADLIVYATGYGSMSGWAAELISPEVAERVGRVWGLGSGTTGDPGPWEGELRNMWKPTHQPGLWFQGGNLQQARNYSRYLAFQIKARQLGLATPVHALAEVYHQG